MRVNNGKYVRQQALVMTMTTTTSTTMAAATTAAIKTKRAWFEWSVPRRYEYEMSKRYRERAREYHIYSLIHSLVCLVCSLCIVCCCCCFFFVLISRCLGYQTNRFYRLKNRLHGNLMMSMGSSKIWYLFINLCVNSTRKQWKNPISVVSQCGASERTHILL